MNFVLLLCYDLALHALSVLLVTYVRQSEPAPRDRNYLSLDNDDPYVLVYLRRNPANGNSILVVLNMSAEPRTVKLDLATLGFKRSSAKNILSALDLGQESPPLAHLSIPPFGVFVGSVHEPIRAELSPPQSRKLRLR